MHRFETPASGERGGNAFLRLAGNRGWIFEKHPTTGEALVEIAKSGVFEAVPLKYKYATADGVCMHHIIQMLITIC